MAAKFLVKRSSVSGQAPNTSQLSTGELALNLPDGILYGSNGTIIFELGSNLTSTSIGGNNLFANSTTVVVNTALKVGEFTIPRADGSANQVLITDGSGNLSWANQSGSSSSGSGGGGVTLHNFVYEISSNTTAISGADRNSNTLSYSPGEEDVYLNGVKLIDGGDDYTASNSSTITLSANAVSGDTVEVISIIGMTGRKEYQYTLTSGTSSLSGSDDNSQTLYYVDGKEQVFLNGVKLVTGDDYATPNTSHITFTSPLTSGDVVEIVVYPSATNDLDEAVAINTSDTSEFTLDTFNATTYRTAKYYIQANTSSDFHSCEAMLTHNGSAAFITQYGSVKSGSDLFTSAADIVGGEVRLRITPSNSGTTFKQKSILIKV